MFSARFDKQGEDEQVSDETETYNISKISQNSTEYDIDSFDIRSQLERQLQNPEIKDSGWIFDRKIQ